MTVPQELDRRFRAAAVALDLLDVGYDIVESPVGSLLIAASDRGLVRISYDAMFGSAGTLEDLSRVVGPRVLRAPRAVDTAHRELVEYFEGRRQAFDLAVDLRGLAPFSLAVLDELAKVPYGSTATYGELATRAGRPGAARAVGMVMNRNPLPIVLPCHRIVGASGSLVGYAGGLDRKVELLRLEGALL